MKEKDRECWIRGGRADLSGCLHQDQECFALLGLWGPGNKVVAAVGAWLAIALTLCLAPAAWELLELSISTCVSKGL